MLTDILNKSRDNKMAKLHLLGLPRIGPDRELKWALEAYWRGALDAESLRRVGERLQHQNWQYQIEQDVDLVTVGDFSWYDQVLDHSLMFNLIPRRFRAVPELAGMDLYFGLARGWQDGCRKIGPSPMLKWFDTNYHYLAPELDDQTFPELHAGPLLEQVRRAQPLGKALKVTLIGPVTLLWLSKVQPDSTGDALDLLETLTGCYLRLIDQLKEAGAQWVQLDEPALCVDLTGPWRSAYERCYTRLAGSTLPIMLATYFGGLRENLTLAFQLPVAAVHIDLVRAPEQLTGALDRLGPNRALSLGVVDGRNIWRSNLEAILETLVPIQERLGDRLWLSSSCSLLHVPYSVGAESGLPQALREGLAFAWEKQAELALLKDSLNDPGKAAIVERVGAAQAAFCGLAAIPGRRDPTVSDRLSRIDGDSRSRGLDPARRKIAQQRILNLPLLPTTTIGSFPQDQAIRQARKAFREGRLSAGDYREQMEAAIENTVHLQERLGLDVLVHGEPERNDMVEYFGEQLEGMATTRLGWVQSYGSRCVKPPIIFADCKRSGGLTLEWMDVARAATRKPVKGMLTGPVTIIAWSFVRDDIPLPVVADQLALCLRDEITDLESAGTNIIQVDEPALRELLPLRESDRPAYLDWAVGAFRLATGAAKTPTQIHTHMCYSQFRDIMPSIKALDADVITIEAARGELALVRELKGAGCTSDLGPGIYDIHSPLLPSAEEMQNRLARILDYLPPEQVWVNPDCGLKTRNWEQVESALAAMVEAAHRQRRKLVAPAAAATT